MTRHRPIEIPTGGRRTEPGRRTRIAASVDPQLRTWLHRFARIHAHIAGMVRLYGRPDRAGGQSLHGETYAERAARGDRTLLYDLAGLVVDEVGAIRAEIQTAMDDTEPTPHPPGTTGKVSEMERRAIRGESLFNANDATVDVS
jgi:hypothetical protein